MKYNRFAVATVLILAMILAGCNGVSQLNSVVNSSLTAAANAVAAAVSVTATPTTPSNSNANTATAPIAPTAVPIVATLPASSGDLASMQSTFEQIYKQVNPSVVYIEVVENASANSNGNPFGLGQSAPAMASGSGFVWDTQGHIVTNNHVVAGTSSINVTFEDGTTVPAKIVGQDPNADLAVIQVNVDPSLLHPVTVGDSTQVQVGQIAVAIGNPFGLTGSMSQGIISGLSRSLPVQSSSPNASSTSGTYNIPDIIQTDAAINPGNSGGVLLNLQGEVIGVTAAIESNTNSNAGIGFVIPSRIVQKVVPSLISNGSYPHPWLGISGVSMDPDLAAAMNLPATQRGALVIDITAGGPAASGGVQPSNGTATINGLQEPVGGDIITSIDGHTINSFEDLGAYLFLNTKPGDTITLSVLRNGKEQSVQVTLGTLPNP